MLGVGDGVTDDILQEDFENTTSFLVNEARDALHTTTTRQTTDSGLGDALDVVAQHLAMTLGATLSQSLTSLSTTGQVSLHERERERDVHSMTAEQRLGSDGDPRGARPRERQPLEFLCKHNLGVLTRKQAF